MSVEVAKPISTKLRCTHGYPTNTCERCPPEIHTMEAAYVIRELIDAAEQKMKVRGHSSECIGSTCHCGAVGDYGKAFNRWSWATVAARNWMERFNRAASGDERGENG